MPKETVQVQVHDTQDTDVYNADSMFPPFKVVIDGTEYQLNGLPEDVSVKIEELEARDPENKNKINVSERLRLLLQVPQETFAKTDICKMVGAIMFINGKVTGRLESVSAKNVAATVEKPTA